MMLIDDIIELKTNTESERLLFATRYLTHIDFTFDLTVLSNGYSGTSHFCTSRKQIEDLCADLTTMTQVLSGSTILEDNDSDASVSFQMLPLGQVIVYGQVGGSHEDHYLKFRFQTDQTCINPLLADFRKLLQYEWLPIYGVIDQILWHDWDPIGINDIGPRDEYQSYTPTIFKLKTSGADRDTIAKALHQIETHTIGILGNLDHCRQVADKIISLK